tara:strand:- start:159 stop:644 length:486 start_codon:yes stop_codon:yes gene_type:complete
MNDKKRGFSEIVKIFTTWRFLLFSAWKLPLILITGVRVKQVTAEDVIVSVPYNYINKNPFNSMYFAVEAMAAELSTGILTILHTDGENISMLVSKLEAKYYKKAISRVHFVCNDGDKILKCIKEVIQTKKSKTCVLKSKGYDLNNICVAEFDITWSLKKRN